MNRDQTISIMEVLAELYTNDPEVQATACLGAAMTTPLRSPGQIAGNVCRSRKRLHEIEAAFHESNKAGVAAAAKYV